MDDSDSDPSPKPKSILKESYDEERPRDLFGKEVAQQIDKLEEMLETNNFTVSPPLLKEPDNQVKETRKIMPTLKTDGDILEVIEKNEKSNESIPDEVIQQANQILSYDNKYFNTQKQIVVYKEYPTVARLLQERDLDRYGIPQCINMVEQYLYVGNSEGFIRVFDLKTQREQEPL